jgi:hypothetical protein
MGEKFEVEVMRRGQRLRFRKRRERRNARQQLTEIAFDVYEEGDDDEELRDKIIEKLEERGSGDWLGIMLKLLEVILPLLLRLMVGT